MQPILVINSGSSSLKYQLVDVSTGESLAGGLLERVTDHREAFAQMLEQLNGPAPIAIGHRVVHGGSKFSEPTLITDSVIADIEDLASLAPLHNPGHVSGIRGAMLAFPGLPQVAVFDTAFHQTMPASSYRYAIPAALEQEHGIRRYGFHGTSHRYVSRKAAEFLGKDLEQFNAVVLHLGNGASACAIKAGKSFDTSMGLTPLQGLVMGTRSGDVDPAIVSYLARVSNLDIGAIDQILNKESGLLGMTGHSDLRDIDALAAAGNQSAIEAIEVYVQRIKHYLGAYIAELGGIDAIIFTAGVGENSASIRGQVCANLQWLGIEIDSAANEVRSRETRDIALAASRVRVLVVPTNEELEIAVQVSELLG